MFALGIQSECVARAQRPHVAAAVRHTSAVYDDVVDVTVLCYDPDCVVNLRAYAQSHCNAACLAAMARPMILDCTCL